MKIANIIKVFHIVGNNPELMYVDYNIVQIHQLFNTSVK